MTRLSTLPSTREQAHHALVLLGVPTAARLLVDVHTALLDGDLSVPALAALLRTEERTTLPLAAAGGLSGSGPSGGPDGSATAWTGGGAGRHGGAYPRPYLICPGLQPDLTANRGVITLSTWDVADRVCTPATARAEALAATVRIAELVGMRTGPAATALLKRLAADVPGGAEAFDPLHPQAVAEAARAALDDPALAAAVAAEQPRRDEAAARARALDEHQRLFGLSGVPHQRGHA